MSKKMKAASLGQSMPMNDVAKDKEMEWEHKRNHDTVMDAMEIMGDPEKMKHVNKLAGRKKKAIQSLKDIHDTLNQKYGPARKGE